MNTPITMTVFTEEQFKTLVKSCIKEEIESFFENKQVPQKNDSMLRQKDLTEKFGVSKQTIINWTNEGIIPASRIGRRVYYKKEDVEKSLKSYRGSSTKVFDVLRRNGW